MIYRIRYRQKGAALEAEVTIEANPGTVNEESLRAMLGVIIMVFFGVLAWLGIRMSIFGWSQETIATQMPTGIPYLAIPLGSIMFCMHLVLTFKDWVDKRWEEIAVTEADIGTEEKVA